MAYSSPEDIKQALAVFGGEYLADFNGDGVADDAQLQEVASYAKGLIDAYLGAAYRLPFDDVPEIIINVSTDIAIWRLAGADAGTMTEAIERRYKEAISALEKIRDGKMVLPDYERRSAFGSDASSSESVLTDTAPRRFSRESLGGL